MTEDLSTETNTSQQSIRCHFQHAERKNCQPRFLHTTKDFYILKRKKTKKVRELWPARAL